MLLVADFHDRDNRDTVSIRNARMYSIIDAVSGKILGKKFGYTIQQEYKLDSKKYANVSGYLLLDEAVISLHNNPCFYNHKKYRYSYVNIDTRTMKVVDSNFSDIVISLFRCADDYYFRVDKWIWKLNFSFSAHVDKPIELNDNRISVVIFGVNYLNWLRFKPPEWKGYIILCVDCIEYDKSVNSVTFRVSPLQYYKDINPLEIMMRASASSRCSVDLNTGSMSYIDSDESSRGIDLDLFNRNLVFGG